MDRLQAAPSRRPYFSGCEHPLTALIKLRADGIPAFANRLHVDHADPHTARSAHRESRHPESHHRMAPGHKAIHLLWRMSLAQLQPSGITRSYYKFKADTTSERGNTRAGQTE
jgi:hypothetical protein